MSKAPRPLALERILQSQGFGSRKACRQLILAGAVRVDGTLCDEPDAAFVPTTDLRLGVEEAEWPWREHLYLALNKPAGYECSHTPQHHRSVFSLLPEHFVTRGVQCAGRLDADTTGLLLLSDDGPWLHALSSPRRHVPKTYRVFAKHAVDDAQVAALLAGVQLHDEPAPLAALSCRQVEEKVLELEIDQGKYHQVKRMVAAAGNRVEQLHRVAVGALVLGDGLLSGLAKGAWCEIESVAVRMGWDVA
ncbi:MAG: pseudouridine synthase [Burkholderiales bacterium]|nr:pseudouridine synthase [Burkholderiales bacterium]